MPTLCELAGAKYPVEFNENVIVPLEGKSLVPSLTDNQVKNERTLFWEHLKNRAIRKGDWKLVSVANGEWELYNLKEDRAELKNLVNEHPEIVEELNKEYFDWVDAVGVKL
jgi:arylsulfatase